MFRARSLVFLIVVIFAAGARGRAAAQSHPDTVKLKVDSVLATDSNEGIDTRLAPVAQHLQAFRYSTYRLVSRQNGETSCGTTTQFTLPGGRILHLQPRGFDGGMISMGLVLFQGSRPLLSTDLEVRNHGVLMVGGPRYEKGMLIISIVANSPAVASAQHHRLLVQPPISSPASIPVIQLHPETVNLKVVSVLASDTNEGFDTQLRSMQLQLDAFRYNTYRLISSQDRETPCGIMVPFMLPGGQILHVQPRSVVNDTIAMELALFQGPRQMMMTDLKLRNNGALFVGGPRYEQGMLILSIGAHTLEHRPTNSAQAEPPPD